MLLKYFYDDRLAQASYLVGCAKTGETLVIDPARDIAPYLAAAQREGLRITHITETHIHADFVSGSRELAAATGATLYLSDCGTPDWKYAFATQSNARLVRDNDVWMVGNIKVQVLATPGHTPEHIAFMITDTAGADEPMGIFTGDCVFAGDVGRPDLLEAAAGMAGTKEPGARQMFATLQRLRALPDYLQIWPGHGAGSACGKALGAIPSTTLGYEKRFSPAFRIQAEDAFVSWLLDGQPEPPRYFAQMKKINKLGPPLLKDLDAPARVLGSTVRAALASGGMVLDLRPGGDFERAHLRGTLSIPATSSNFSTYAGWFVNYALPVHLIVPDPAHAHDLVAALRAIGIDHIAGIAGPDAIGEHAEALPTISATQLSARLGAKHQLILDVRGKSEYDDVHIAGSRHILLGDLPRRLDDIPRDQTVVLQCASGYRSQIATSLLRARGFDNVINLADNKSVWEKVLPIEVNHV